MDPRIYRSQPDLASDSSNGDEGVDYLRRLKGAVVEGAPADPVARGGGEAPAAANNVANNVANRVVNREFELQMADK